MYNIFRKQVIFRNNYFLIETLFRKLYFFFVQRYEQKLRQERRHDVVNGSVHIQK